MSNQCAVIIAASITVVGTVLTFLFNLLFNKFINKKTSQEKFFYEIFSKRLSLYEDIILWNDNVFNACNNGSSFKETIINTLITFEGQSKLYGTKELECILFNLRNAFGKAFLGLDCFISTIEDKPKEVQISLITAYIKTFTDDSLKKLITYIEQLPYTNYMDKIQSEIIKK